MTIHMTNGGERGEGSHWLTSAQHTGLNPERYQFSIANLSY